MSPIGPHRRAPWADFEDDTIKAIDPETLRPTGEVLHPCPARIAGPFLTNDASYQRCSLLRDHDGPHRATVEWSDPISRADGR